jgi:heavy metal sensor kinase
MSLLKKTKSVRFTLTLWYSTVLLVAFAVFGVTVYVYLQHLLEATLDQNLVEDVEWMSRLVEVEQSTTREGESMRKLTREMRERIVQHYTENPMNYIVLLTDVEGQILYESENRHNQILLGSQVPSGQTIMRTLDTRDYGHLHVAARRSNPFIIQVAYTDKATKAVLGHLVSIFAVMVPVVLFLSFSGGWLLAGMALRPIRQISQLTNRITAQRLHERIPPREVDDELGQLIKTINGMIARLQSAFEQMRDFSMSMAHELKTPLTIMKGEAELALAKPPSIEETQRLITTYLEEVVRMSRIVEDLLTLARAEAGQITIGKEPVNLNELIQELYEDAVILSSSKQLIVELVKNEPVVVQGDRVRLRQLFRALITNAVQYTDPGGKVSITSEFKEGNVSIDVEDTGIGIPPESLDKVFQRFFRVEEARSRVRGGSGLGLSVAKWIAEAHNGTISVVSTPGKGSRFTVRLPISQTSSLPS